jgi:hypothetical protein
MAMTSSRHQSSVSLLWNGAQVSLTPPMSLQFQELEEELVMHLLLVLLLGQEGEALVCSQEEGIIGAGRGECWEPTEHKERERNVREKERTV